MTQELLIQKEESDGITWLTMNRPEKRNALNLALIENLTTSLKKIGENPAIRAVIIKAEGSLFCAGLDLEEALDTNNTMHTAEKLARLFHTLYTLPQTTIAAVNGGAFAGGAGLMLACDIVLADEKARFAFPEVRRGLVPALIMALLIRQLSPRNIRELTLLGEAVDAAKAEQIGLINRYVPKQLLDETAHHTARLCLKGAPQAMQLTKRLIESLHPGSISDDFDCALKIHEKARLSSEAEEGLSAFSEKRKPAWS